MNKKQVEAKREEMQEAMESYKRGLCTLPDIPKCASREYYRCVALSGAYPCLLDKLSSLGVVMSVDEKLPRDSEDYDYHLGYKLTVPLEANNG